MAWRNLTSITDLINLTLEKKTDVYQKPVSLDKMLNAKSYDISIYAEKHNKTNLWPI